MPREEDGRDDDEHGREARQQPAGCPGADDRLLGAGRRCRRRVAAAVLSHGPRPRKRSPWSPGTRPSADGRDRPLRSRAPAGASPAVGFDRHLVRRHRAGRSNRSVWTPGPAWSGRVGSQSSPPERHGHGLLRPRRSGPRRRPAPDRQPMNGIATGVPASTRSQSGPVSRYEMPGATRRVGGVSFRSAGSVRNGAANDGRASRRDRRGSEAARS